ncbi:hypothetical protein [Paenibacillus sp. QZ-Y1]|uniref:hypothetical protein n=1 Tax=Paenibacillus sp. QZ-Y1 TaxID=3414511 RepID=UPI003F79A152
MKPFNKLYYSLMKKGFVFISNISVFDEKDGRPSLMIHCPNITKAELEEVKEYLLTNSFWMSLITSEGILLMDSLILASVTWECENVKFLISGDT